MRNKITLLVILNDLFCLIKVTIKQKQRNTCDTGTPYYWNKPRFVWIYWLQYTSSDTAGAPWLWETYRPKLGQRGRQQAAVSRVAPCLLISLSRCRRHHTTSSFSFHFHTSHQLPTTYIRNILYLDEPSTFLSSTLLPLRLMTPTGFVCFRLLSSR